MAKIRIYELARELNMTNKALLEEVRNMDISVKSHMSSLDEKAVAKVKTHLFGTPEKEIEETRIKPTVIRRRKKPLEKEPVLEEATPEQEKLAQEATLEETIEGKQSLEEIEPGKKEKESIVEIETVKDEGAVEAKKAVVEDIKGKKKVLDESVVPIDLAKEKLRPKKKDEAKPKKPPSVAKKIKPKKVARKVIKDTPAKIIKLPVTPPPDKKTPAVKPVKKIDRKKGAPATAVPVKDSPVKEKKKQKRVKKVDEVAKDKKFFKKKISFRKKAVVEGKDLYTKDRRARKGRKGLKVKSSAAEQKPLITIPKAIKRRVKIDDTIVLSDLAKRMGIKAGDIIQKLMALGVMATVNQTIDFDTAVLVASEFDYELEKASFEEETILKLEQDDPDKLIQKPPVVTIMGHVDHGKTSLLDVIRKTRVTENEAGGITQHIGAYHVSTNKGQIVFLDTPGHEAFTEMRARGAKVTDLVILVVAADDGVMPQTIEAINHAKAAKVPIIVAINKIDKANADPDRVKRELADVGLVPEDWGGETIFVHVSAKMSQGIDDLLEMILLQAEMLELKANPDKLAQGHVVEAKLDSGRGPVATVLIQQGTLKLHDPVVCGIHYGKARALLDDGGMQVISAGPSIPVEIIGLSGVPNAGDELIALSDEKNAKQVSAHRIQKQRSSDLARSSKLSLEKLYEQLQKREVKGLNLIIKADVHGSIEALVDSLTKLSNDEVKISIVHSATGTLTESDISLATVSDAIIIGFNVRPTSKIQALAQEEHVDIRFYNVIYNIIKDIKSAIVGMMASTFEERILGRAEVREMFHVPKVGAIAGCYVTEGKVERGQLARVLRDWVVNYESTISSLRRFKDDAKEVQSGYECGIGIENYNDIKVGDIVECYYLEEIKPELDQ